MDVGDEGAINLSTANQLVAVPPAMVNGETRPPTDEGSGDWRSKVGDQVSA